MTLITNVAQAQLQAIHMNTRLMEKISGSKKGISTKT